MVRDNCRLLGELDIESTRFHVSPIELIAIHPTAIRQDIPAHAEAVFAAGGQRCPVGGPGRCAVSQVQESAKMVEVTVAENQAIRLRRVNSQQAVVGEQVLTGQRKIDEDLAPLVAAKGLEVKC